MLVRTARAILIAALVLPTATLAENHPRRIAQYTHARWSAESNAPGPIFTIAQGKDGYIWLGAGDGLYRFDGVSFEKIVPEGDVDPAHRAPTALLVTRSGDVWLNYAISGRFAVYRDGALRLIPSPKDRGGDQVVSLVETPDGAIWASLAPQAREPFRYKDGHWRSFGVKDGLPDDITGNMFVAADGTLWVEFDNSIARLRPGQTRFETVWKATEGAFRIAEGPEGRIWILRRNAAYPLTGPGGRGILPKVRFPYPTADPAGSFRAKFDRAGNLWFATQFGGIQRVVHPNPNGAASQAEAIASVETLRATDGLTTDITMNPFEDREGNVWITTEKGLDKFRPASLRAEPLLTKPPRWGDVLLSARNGTVYVAETDTVYRIVPKGNPEPILRNTTMPEAMCEAPDGAVWMTFADRVLVWKDGQSRQLPARPTFEPISRFFSCAFDRRGDYWATIPELALYRFRDGRWESMFGPANKETFYPRLMIQDSRQRLVIRWADNTISWLDYPKRWSMSPGISDESSIARGTLYETLRGDIITTGTFGFIRIRNGISRALSEPQRKLYDRVEGIAETPEGDTWTVSQARVARTRSHDLEHAFSDPKFMPPTLELSYDDGLPNRVYGASGRSVVRGGDGRLWIATLGGTVWLDPKQLVRNPVPPNVVIASVKVGDIFHRDPTRLKLPAAPATVEINYAVLSFANPKRVAMRYKLEGYDADWIDPGARRQAFYTNLPPGEYRFRVIAANNEGVWNRTGATLVFEVPPTFFQSRWFFGICLAIGLALLWLLYRLRVRQLAHSIRIRLEERLSERERIARELHDTLLQSVQGLILRFQSVANRMPSEEQTRIQLDTALKRADDIVVDGRNRVRNLRPSDPHDNLQDLIQDLVDDAGFDPPIPVRVVVEGKARPVDPLVSEEIRRIAGEALFNVARHAQANAVDAIISFAAQTLSVQIRDDGVGIPADVVEAGRKADHFGLIGMRERAERIGAALSIASEPGKGSEITIVMPARLAFKNTGHDRWQFAKWNPFRKATADG
jgi:signal transduction histidine kinase/ligand-binding sensor domain-containing protein